jgi:hypothetical protein
MSRRFFLRGSAKLGVAATLPINPAAAAGAPAAVNTIVPVTTIMHSAGSGYSLQHIGWNLITRNVGKFLKQECGPMAAKLIWSPRDLRFNESGPYIENPGLDRLRGSIEKLQGVEERNPVAEMLDYVKSLDGKIFSDTQSARSLFQHGDFDALFNVAEVPGGSQLHIKPDGAIKVLQQMQTWVAAYKANPTQAALVEGVKLVQQNGGSVALRAPTLINAIEHPEALKRACAGDFSALRGTMPDVYGNLMDQVKDHVDSEKNWGLRRLKDQVTPYMCERFNREDTHARFAPFIPNDSPAREKILSVWKALLADKLPIELRPQSTNANAIIRSMMQGFTSAVDMQQKLSGNTTEKTASASKFFDFMGDVLGIKGEITELGGKTGEELTAMIDSIPGFREMSSVSRNMRNILQKANPYDLVIYMPDRKAAQALAKKLDGKFTQVLLQVYTEDHYTRNETERTRDHVSVQQMPFSPELAKKFEIEPDTDGHYPNGNFVVVPYRLLPVLTYEASKLVAMQKEIGSLSKLGTPLINRIDPDKDDREIVF